MTKHDELEELREEVARLESENEYLQGEISQCEKDYAELDDECKELRGLPAMEDALETVKYWLHDFLFHDKPMRDPHDILRIIEDALA